MSVEEAKTYLKNYPCICKYGSSPYACKDREGCEFGKAIRKLIDNAQEVKHSLLPLSGEADNAYMRGYEVGKAEGILKASTRQKGEWIPKRLWDNTHIWVCSECGNPCKHGISIEKACWKCGADMWKGEKNETDD